MKRKLSFFRLFALISVGTFHLSLAETGGRSLYANQVLYARAGLGRKRSTDSLSPARDHRTVPAGSGTGPSAIVADPGMGSFAAMNPFIPGSPSAGSSPALADPGMSSFGGVWAGYIPTGIGSFIPGFAAPLQSTTVAPRPIPPPTTATTSTTTTTTPKTMTREEIEFRNNTKMLPSLIGQLQKVVRALSSRNQSYSQGNSRYKTSTTTELPTTEPNYNLPASAVATSPYTSSYSSSSSANAGYSSYIPAAYASYSGVPAASSAKKSLSTVTEEELEDLYEIYGVYGYPVLIPVDEDVDIEQVRRVLAARQLSHLKKKRSTEEEEADTTRNVKNSSRSISKQNRNSRNDTNRNRTVEPGDPNDKEEAGKRQNNSENNNEEGHGETRTSGYSGNGWRKGSHGGGQVAGENYNYQWSY